MAEANADIGLIGLAVMGQNLVLNMDDHGFTVAVYNRTREKTDEFAKGPAKGTKVIPTESLEEFVSTLKRPRRVMLMVKAGNVVDIFIDKIKPLLEPGDIIIDGGNSHYPDTERRTKALAEENIHFIGTGVSGGEEGARHGPSIMPGGSAEAWPHMKNILQSIAAKAPDGAPCCDWVGDGGAGHYVKMVHNGIEYGDMQLISEVFDIMKRRLKMDYEEMADVFDSWNSGRLESYLIEISRDILRTRDEDGQPLVEKILDTAGQKGTGKWTVVDGATLGMPITLIAEAVFARVVSSFKDQRVAAAKVLGEPEPEAGVSTTPDAAEKKRILEDLEKAMYAAKVTSYAQGFMLIREAAGEYNWNIDYGAVAGMWRGGCIIRSAFLSDITAAFASDPELASLLVTPAFASSMKDAVSSWRRVVSEAVQSGVPAPALSSSLAFYEGYRTPRLPASMLQAQRDYFGAHTYERVDQPRGKFFHTNWTGTGGDVTSGTYDI